MRYSRSYDEKDTANFKAEIPTVSLAVIYHSDNFYQDVNRTERINSVWILFRSNMKPTVNCLLHLDERNNCCNSVTSFSLSLFSLINIVRVSIKNK
jgi:hypothetical protein